jgi:hypothetical protein
MHTLDQAAIYVVDTFTATVPLTTSVHLSDWSS